MLMYELSGDIIYIQMHCKFPEMIVRKNDNVFFHKHFLNMDISLNIPYNAFKFETYINEIQMQ